VKSKKTARRKLQRMYNFTLSIVNEKERGDEKRVSLRDSVTSIFTFSGFCIIVPGELNDIQRKSAKDPGI
jgi:hypothetical protein